MTSRDIEGGRRENESTEGKNQKREGQSDEPEGKTVKRFREGGPARSEASRHA